MRRIGLILVALLALAGLTACANYAGDGNSFSILATVTESSGDAVRINHITVQSSQGEANGWFDDNGGWFEQDHWMLHNNFHDGDSIWAPKRYVGHTYDREMHEIPLETVKVGQHIQALGKIRSDKEGKSSSYRAVFDQLYLTA
jgi:hypothetical protein